jgi:predicted dehydrogenase
MGETLKVGIIGVSAERGWAREGHVPAVQALDGLELAAVATQDQRTASAAAAAFGVERAYGTPADLIADRDLDIVTVAAPVPAHRELIMAALAAGKHVLTEWPVGTSTAQTQEIAARSDDSGLRTAVGLQSRMNPAALRAVELAGSGEIGRILSATVYSATAAFGRRVAEAGRYLEDPASAMNLSTIQTAHTLDFAIRLAGRLTSLAALTTIQYPDLEVGDPPAPGHRVVPDHVLVHGRLSGGGALAVEVAGGRPADDTPFRMDLVGEDGVLTLTGGAPRGFQSGLLSLALNGQCIDTGGGETAGLPDAAVNVAGVYAALRDDIRQHTSTAPNFDHAVRLSHLIDDLHTSATAQRTVTPSAAWP